MKLLSEYSSEDKEKILVWARRRKLCYQIHYLTTKISRWSKDNYTPLQITDRRAMLLFARSIMKTANKMQNLAQELIDILEVENVR